MSGPLVLSLCDYTGRWSEPYRLAGYTVMQIDLRHGKDVRLLEFAEPVQGILAAPPCTCFANSGARWPRTREQMLAALSIVDACLRLVTVCKPQWWALENPIGKLTRYLGQPAYRFDPYEYAGWTEQPWAEAYTKRTCLWGNFAVPEKRPVEPVRGSRMHTNVRNPKRRADTPMGFARAFYEANR